MSQSNHLLIMRHADAAAGTGHGDDMARELTPHGQEQAAARRQAVLEAAPQMVLCSAATRARQTLAGLGPLEAAVLIEEGIYTASTTSLLLRLAELPSVISRVMVIGHLPTVGAVTQVLLAEGQRRVMFTPSALAHLELPTDWSSLTPSSARLLALHR